MLVLAAPGAAGVLTHPESPGKVALTFVGFCVLASATYLLNDVHDRAEDRAHPRKRLRPIAAGAVTVPAAVALAIALMAAGLGLLRGGATAAGSPSAAATSR